MRQLVSVELYQEGDEKDILLHTLLYYKSNQKVHPGVLHKRFRTRLFHMPHAGKPYQSASALSGEIGRFFRASISSR
jgi:hypothetical protein